MMEHDDETVPGLPGPLPPGERMLWQGAPDWRVLAQSMFPARLIALWFAVLALAGLAAGSVLGAVMTLASGLLCLGVLALLAWSHARTSMYTLTTKRIVFKVGVALPKCVNLPLKLIGAGDLRPRGRGYGDIALTMLAGNHKSFLMLWPHVRAWKRQPQPLLRAIPDAEMIAARIASAVAALEPIERTAAIARPAAAPAQQPMGAAA